MAVQQKQHVEAVGYLMVVSGLISVFVFNISQIPSRRIVLFCISLRETSQQTTNMLTFTGITVFELSDSMAP
jgi:hypothetical protein